VLYTARNSTRFGRLSHILLLSLGILVFGIIVSILLPLYYFTVTERAKFQNPE